MSPAPSFIDRFADFEGHAYLDAATQGPLPLAAGRAARDAIAAKERPHRIKHTLYGSMVAELRALHARLFRCRDEQVAITTGAGHAVNVVARGLSLGEGDEVVLPRSEFPSNRYPWLWLARRGVKVVEVEPDHPSGAVSAEKLAAAVTEKTRVVAFALVSYLHGGRIDPAPVVAAARKVSAVTVMDASQAAGAMPIDFGASGVDLLTASGYKHLLGPYGTGVGLFSPALLAKLPVGDIVWWAVTGSEDFNHLPGADFQLKEGAARFDAHEPASFVNGAALAECLRFVLEVTPQAVQAQARALIDRLTARLPPGIAVASPEGAQKSHIVCLAGPDPKATAEAHQKLAAAKVVTSLRGDRIRVSPHVYSTEADVDRLVEALR